MKTKKNLNTEEKVLLELLTLVFSNKDKNEISNVLQNIISANDKLNWVKLFDIANKHGVLALLYEVLENRTDILENEMKRLKVVSRKIILQNYHLLFLGKSIIQLLKENSIDVVLLKGSGTSEFYPVPELRKSGDIDILLLEPQNLSKAQELIENAGLIKLDEQLANHHVAYKTKENIEIELHTMFAEPFDNRKTNKYFENIQKNCASHVVWREVMGVMLPVFEDAYHAFYLLLHMLQHFLRSGFGLKLFCDWIAFWKREISIEQKNEFLRLVEESGLKKFAQTVTAACIAYLGLSSSNVSFLFERTLTEYEARLISEKMIMEVMEAEEFGKSSAERMVMLRGTGISGYIREFHHQMQLNFPKSGKIFLLWPVLWIVTFIRFINNNRRLRKVSSKAVFSKAKQRSELMKELSLFK